MAITSTLSAYITDVQSLVHDTSYSNWTQADLTGYINQARSDVALDMHCVRTFVTNLQFLVGQEIYNINGAVGGANTSLEQTLDSAPVNVSQQIATARQVYKGGIFKVGVKLKGWEMPGKWKQWCQANMPQLLNPSAPGSGSTVAAAT